MKLIQFYRQLFLEATRVYEPVWEEEAVVFGYRWHKRNYPLWEQFQIKDMEPDHPVLMYSLILPEAYLETTIYEEIKRYPSKYELSIVILNRQIFLNATLQTDKLQDSMMGFMHQARGELMNILDCIIRMPDEAELQATLV
ncbi:hypothetical protein [Cohnella cholangitidis]|uniref:Uncharacterized protein n=1 Tax=Cohnella cholangitidis TaxID=2598458 RepID=A0A7G5BWT2_9BACL|nr:hypothetical protein [Cohnella cholangitidis]QMV41416.1 hypothetical protein FPL14_09590 [Cohnella cholangitidis]